MKRILPLLLLAAAPGFAADVTIATSSAIASQCYAVGDTVTVSDGSAGAVLALASAGYQGVDSDGNEVDAPVLAWGAENRHTITLERSGNAVGGVYVADGVEGVVYEAFYETEDGAAVTFARGTWGSSESAAEHVDDAYFAGPGILKVQHDRNIRPTMVLIN